MNEKNKHGSEDNNEENVTIYVVIISTKVSNLTSWIKFRTNLDILTNLYRLLKYVQVFQTSLSKKER